MKLLSAKQWTKVYNQLGVKHRLTVIGELVHLEGNDSAHFSITGCIEFQARNNRWVLVSGGAIHDDILKHFPQLQPLVDIHLSDENGTPLHAFANSAYWAQLDMVKTARHLRITENRAWSMLAYVQHHFGHEYSPAGWQDACEEQGLATQWQKDADTAKALMNKV